MTLNERLFRWRSWWPLALLPAYWIAYRFPRVSEGGAAEAWWEGSSIAMAIAWWLARVYIVGTGAAGTSGRTTAGPEAASLNTTGAYSIVRHPLYIANIGITTSLALFTHSLYAALFALIATSAFFVGVGKHEDLFLEERFGEAYLQWKASVPGWLPRFDLWRPPAHPFHWPRVARREFYTLSVILVLSPILDLPDEFQEHMSFIPDQVYIWCAVVGAGIFVLFRAAKKVRRTQSSGP